VSVKKFPPNAFSFFLSKHVRATEQWFANLDTIKDAAVAVLEGVQFYPEACSSAFFLSVKPILYLS
jgi:hypothetical protein